MKDDLVEIIRWILAAGGPAALIGLILQWRKDHRDDETHDLDIIDRLRKLTADELAHAHDQLDELRRQRLADLQRYRADLDAVRADTTHLHTYVRALTTWIRDIGTNWDTLRTNPTPPPPPTLDTTWE